MSYVKLHYTVTDFAAGFQSVNQLRDNFQALYDAWILEHSSREVFGSDGRRTNAPNLALSFGRHNTPKVPRAVVKTSLFTTGASVVFPGAIEVQPVVSGVARISTGLFFLGITDLQEFYAECEPTTEPGKAARMVIPRSYIGGRGAPVGVSVECYEDVAGAFELTDFDFSAVIYGTVA
jgi:hypothetical protein